MELTNMKMTESQRDNAMPTSPSKEQYPWGLRIHLDNEGITKLGLTELPKAGGTLTITAKAKVASVSVNENDGGKTRKDLDLQITDMAIGEDTPKKSAADTLYPK